MVNWRLLSVIIALTSLCAMPCFSVTPADTLSLSHIDLEGVIVTARNYTVLSDGISVVPTSRERNTSTSGFQLIERMQVPILVINPVDNKINLNTGEEVTYFINGVLSTLTEVKAIVPKDIKRIEILRRPLDPKYEGVPAVINFIVRNSTYGGYVTADANQSFTYLTGDYSIYSRYSTNHWSLQAIGGINYTNSSGDSTIQTSKYLFPDIPPIIMEDVSMEKKFRKRQIYGAFEAVRSSTSGNTLAIKAGIRYFNNPEISTRNTTVYNGDVSLNDRTNEMWRSVPFVTASYHWMLAPSSQIFIKGELSGVSGKSKNIYSSNEINISNHVRENVITPVVKLSYMKNFSNDNELSITLDGKISRYVTNYSGTVISRQKLLSQDYAMSAQWRYTFHNNWMMQLMCNLPMSLTRTNHDQTDHDIYPGFSGYFTGIIGTKNSISFFISRARDPKILTSYNNLDRIDTEYEGVVGNVNLKPSSRYNMSASYTWLYSNKFQLSFAMNYERAIDDCAEDYVYKNNIIYNRLVNSGNLNSIETSISSTIKLFSGKFTISPRTSIKKIHHSGIYNVTFWQPYASLSLTYMPSNSIYLTCFASTPAGKIYYNSAGGYEKSHNAYLKIQGGYVKKNYSVSLSITPLYDSDYGVYYKQSRIVDFKRYSWRKIGEKRLTLSLKYTIDYGKSVSRNKLYIENMNTTSVR
ncbi:MAG: hypothetical protein NC411_04960 [Bacteroides sp.]|nr:hypothetical protein [Bacteroides sp.]